MKLLMHICCSNCCIYPFERFLLNGFEIKGLWFNPNIHPYTEYTSRMESVAKLQKLWNFEIEYIDEYPLDSFLKSIAGTGARRCEICYSTRLERTAAAARKMNMDGFTTSLIASPYQKFDVIISIGENIARREGLQFHVEDLRQGWHLSRGLSLEFGLYRQKYCGCIYSEMERYMKKKKKG